MQQKHINRTSVVSDSKSTLDSWTDFPGRIKGFSNHPYLRLTDAASHMFKSRVALGLAMDIASIIMAHDVFTERNDLRNSQEALELLERLESVYQSIAHQWVSQTESRRSLGIMEYPVFGVDELVIGFEMPTEFKTLLM